MYSVHGLTSFSLAWVVGVYLVNCLIAREWKRIKLKPLVLYVTTVAMIGTFGEVFWDSLYEKLFGSPLWQYHVLPLHNAHTSVFAAALWGYYGFYLYLLYDTIQTKYRRAVPYLPLLFSLEALVVEALVSLTYKWWFGSWLYYYLPNGLWHVSAFQNFPLYLLAGYVITGTIKRFQASPYFFVLMNLALLTVLIWLV